MKDARKTVLVFGATGDQGGAVTAELLRLECFAVRVILRQPESTKAKALAAAGAEVVRGDQTDIRSVKAAMTSVYAVFAVTAFW